MTTADLVAQLAFLLFSLIAIGNRELLEDMSDGNVERLEREERVAEARRILPLMQEARVA